MIAPTLATFTTHVSAQYGPVEDLGSGNAGLRVAAFNAAANMRINGSSKGRTRSGSISDIIKVQAGSAQITGGGESSLSVRLTAGKTYVVAFVSGVPVGLYELSNASASRASATVMMLNQSGKVASFNASGQSLGSVANGRLKIATVPPTRTSFTASGQSLSRVSLRRGRVFALILTRSGLYLAS